MSRLVWDNIGERLYETGVEKGVLFPFANNAYGKGVAWNGLTAVNENPSGAEATKLWADDIQYLNMLSAEEFGCTIEAYTYPPEFEECDGSAQAAEGLFITQQPRKPFGFAYMSKIGNDTTGTDYGYKIHLVYGALASPSGKDRGTINDTPEAMTFSWEVTTTPVAVRGYKPTAHLIISSVDTPAAVMTKIKNAIWGVDADSTASPAIEASDPRLPLPDEIIGMYTDQ